MTKTFQVTDDTFIRALGPTEAEDPIIFIYFDDHPEQQVIPIFGNEIKLLIAALTEAAVWLANQVKE